MQIFYDKRSSVDERFDALATGGIFFLIQIKSRGQDGGSLPKFPLKEIFFSIRRNFL